jgi:hypothetical protein
MPNDQINNFEFGKVIARLDAQDRILTEVHQDIEKIFSMLHVMQQQEANRCREQPKESMKPSDWGRELVVAILGAVAYFILDHFITGGK